jgi:hypothetical protein
MGIGLFKSLLVVVHSPKSIWIPPPLTFGLSLKPKDYTMLLVFGKVLLCFGAHGIRQKSLASCYLLKVEV